MILFWIHHGLKPIVSMSTVSGVRLRLIGIGESRAKDGCDVRPNAWINADCGGRFDSQYPGGIGCKCGFKCRGRYRGPGRWWWGRYGHDVLYLVDGLCSRACVYNTGVIQMNLKSRTLTVQNDRVVKWWMQKMYARVYFWKEIMYEQGTRVAQTSGAIILVMVHCRYTLSGWRFNSWKWIPLLATCLWGSSHKIYLSWITRMLYVLELLISGGVMKFCISNSQVLVSECEPLVPWLQMTYLFQGMQGKSGQMK